VLSISGCSGEQQTKLAYIKGTLAWRQGNWNNAVLYFYEAESLAAELPDENMAQYTDSALASAYLMQGEDTAASRKLENISETAPDILRAHRFYQQGIIAFRAKEYAQAAALFRKSLELNGAKSSAIHSGRCSIKLRKMPRKILSPI